MIQVVPNEVKYWNFIRDLRQNGQVTHGFVEQVQITDYQQERYMMKYGDSYFVALYDNVPAGFVGVIDGDIRVATHPDFQGRGVGVAMIKFIQVRFPSAFAKIKVNNVASMRLFEKCGYKTKFLIMYNDDDENTI